MSYTQDDLTAIDRAIAQGVLSVTKDGNTVTYRNLDEMLRTRGVIARQIAATAGTAPARHVYPSMTRGT